MTSGRAAAIAIAIGATACGASTPTPPAYEPKDQAKCSITRSQSRPLIVEWPPADRLALETQARQGVVAVRYAGCEMEVLRRCRAPGRYAYSAATPQEEHVLIRNEDELYAAIPVHAAAFEGKLRSAGSLQVDLTMVGAFDADTGATRFEDLRGDCAGATHVISSLVVGAFEFGTGAESSAGAGASVSGHAGLGADQSQRRETLSRAGDRSTCASSPDNGQPPVGCAAPVRIEVVALVGATPATARPTPAQQPAAAPPAAPRATAPPARRPDAPTSPSPFKCPPDFKLSGDCCVEIALPTGAGLPPAPPPPPASDTGLPTWWDVKHLANEQVNSAPWKKCGYGGKISIRVGFERSGYVRYAEMGFQHASPELKAISSATRVCIERAFWNLRIPPFKPGTDQSEPWIFDAGGDLN